MNEPKPRVARKTSRRIWMVDEILACLRGDNIFHTLDYRNRPESYLKQYMHQPLQHCMNVLAKRFYPRLSQQAQDRKAREALFWEGDIGTEINNIRFLGVQHRPDFKVVMDGTRIAVEIKRGDNGSSVREGLGQSLVYACSGDFEFVVYLFADTSREKKILSSLERELDRRFVASLWENYNIRFGVV